MCWHSTRHVVSCRSASKDNISGWVLCNSKASPCFMFMLPGSLVCLLSSQAVDLAELPPRLICSQRDSEPSVDLNGQPTEGFFHKIVFHWCYTLTSAEACIPELPLPPFQCFCIFNMTERTLILSSQTVLWGPGSSLVPAQAGPSMPGEWLCFLEHPCWEGDSSVEEFHLEWNSQQAQCL